MLGQKKPFMVKAEQKVQGFLPCRCLYEYIAVYNDCRVLLHGYLAKQLRRSSEVSIAYRMSHSESTKELASPPKNGTSKRSKPSAAAMSVSTWNQEGKIIHTVSVGMHSEESDKAYVNDKQHP